MYQPISAQKYSADTSRLSEVYQDYDLLLCLGFSVVALIDSTAIGYRLIPFPSVDKSVKLVITNVHMGQCGSLDDDATQRPSRSVHPPRDARTCVENISDSIPRKYILGDVILLPRKTTRISAST